MFVKLINEKVITPAPKNIFIGDSIIVNPTAEQYAQVGYYELIEQEKPKIDKWYHINYEYELKNNQIVKKYFAEKDEEPIYSELVKKYIREEYSIEDEIAILRQKENSEGKKSDFDNYNSFCENCKIKATKDIEEWQKA